MTDIDSTVLIEIIRGSRTDNQNEINTAIERMQEMIISCLQQPNKKTWIDFFGGAVGFLTLMFFVVSAGATGYYQLRDAITTLSLRYETLTSQQNQIKTNNERNAEACAKERREVAQELLHLKYKIQSNSNDIRRLENKSGEK